MQDYVKARYNYLVAILLALFMLLPAGCASSDDSGDTARSVDVVQDAEASAEYAPFVFEVALDEALSYSGNFVVEVTGATDAGDVVDDFYRAKPNERYSLDYGPGTYSVVLFDGEIAIGDEVYSASSVKVIFTGDKELVASLELVLDETATVAKHEEQRAAEEAKRKEAQAKAEAEAKAKEEEAQRKAEEEAKKKAEEEARAAEEAEAAARAEQEAQEKAAAQAEEVAGAEEEAAATAAATEVTRSTTSSEVTYVGNRNSHKFHYPGCGSVAKMKESNKVFYYGDRQELINDGYEPCKNCNP